MSHYADTQVYRSSTQAEKGYTLGWKPQKQDEEWKACIPVDFQMIMAEEPEVGSRYVDVE